MANTLKITETRQVDDDTVLIIAEINGAPVELTLDVSSGGVMISPQTIEVHADPIQAAVDTVTVAAADPAIPSVPVDTTVTSVDVAPEGHMLNDLQTPVAETAPAVADAVSAADVQPSVDAAPADVPAAVDTSVSADAADAAVVADTTASPAEAPTPELPVIEPTVAVDVAVDQAPPPVVEDVTNVAPPEPVVEVPHVDPNIETAARVFANEVQIMPGNVEQFVADLIAMTLKVKAAQ